MADINNKNQTSIPIDNKMNLMDIRKDLRSKMTAKRKEMLKEEVSSLSQRICRNLKQLQPIMEAKVIMGYSSIGNEVNLVPWLNQLKQDGRTILLPRVKGDHLEAIELKDWEDTAQGSFGIREPKGKAFAVDKIDVVLVPGLVFDANGYRLGYGKGYYDRFLPGLKKNCFYCGVCYEYQVVDNVYPHSNDVPVKWIVTDRSEIAIDMDYF